MSSQSQSVNDSKTAQNADSATAKNGFMADLRERSAECAENAAQAAIARMIFSGWLLAKLAAISAMATMDFVPNLPKDKPFGKMNKAP